MNIHVFLVLLSCLLQFASSDVYVVPALHPGWHMGIYQGHLAAFWNEYEASNSLLYGSEKTVDGFLPDALAAHCSETLDCVGYRSTGTGPDTGILYLGNGTKIVDVTAQALTTGIFEIEFIFETSPIPDIYTQRSIWFDGDSALLTLKDGSTSSVPKGTLTLKNTTAVLSINITTTNRVVRSPVLDRFTPYVDEEPNKVLIIVVSILFGIMSVSITVKQLIL